MTPPSPSPLGDSSTSPLSSHSRHSSSSSSFSLVQGGKSLNERSCTVGERIAQLLSPQHTRNILHRVDNVHVHPSFKHDRISSNSIAGCVLLLKQSDNDNNNDDDDDHHQDSSDPGALVHFVWCPYSLLMRIDPHLAVHVGEHGQIIAGDDGGSPGAEQASGAHIYAIDVKLCEIECVKKATPMMGWAHMIITLHGGVSHPPLYFHNGGMLSLFENLSQWVILQRSRHSDNVYIVRPLRQLPLERSLTEMQFDQYFNEIYNNPNASSEQHDLSWQLLEWGTRVSKAARNIKHSLLQRQSSVVEGDSHLDEDGFEVIEVVKRRQHSPPSPPLSPSTRVSKYSAIKLDGDIYERTLPDDPPIDLEHWHRYFDSDGRIVDAQLVKREIFYRGLMDDDTRREVWPFLLGYYTWDSTCEQREQVDMERMSMYATIKSQWTTISPVQEQKNAVIMDRKSRVEKDVLRIDRHVNEFAGGETMDDNEYLRKLYDILVTYSVYNLDLGYCQGMGDMLSPILQIMQGNEAQSFWLFASLMDSRSVQMDCSKFSHLPIEEAQQRVNEMQFQIHQMEGNFMTNSIAMDLQLQKLASLVKTMDPGLYSYLEDNESHNFFFCFRWILILFKREFEFEEVKNLWERFWSQHLSVDFHLFMAYTILDMNRDRMIDHNLPFDEILKLCVELSETLDWKDIFGRSVNKFFLYERICDQH